MRLLIRPRVLRPEQEDEDMEEREGVATRFRGKGGLRGMGGGLDGDRDRGGRRNSKRARLNGDDEDDFDGGSEEEEDDEVG